MQRDVSLVFRLAWLGVAGCIVAASCHVALRVLPMCGDLYLSFGLQVPVPMRVLAAVGPPVLIAAGTLAALAIVTGEFVTAYRAFRVPVVAVVLALVVMCGSAVFIPLLQCGVLARKPPAKVF